MRWYVASFVTHRQLAGIIPNAFPSREYWCLLMAGSSEEAYDKSVGLATRIAGQLTNKDEGEWTLDGMSDLVMVAESPAPGTELTWEEEELLPHELDKRIKNKSELRAFRAPAGSRPGGGEWYVAEILLAEVHDTGSHGDAFLVWTNSHLIQAPDTESAYNSAIELGNMKASEPGSHRCNGDTAHFEFRGLRNLIQTIDPPGDGATLWFEESNLSSDQLRALVPPRSSLSVFEWERKRRENA